MSFTIETLREVQRKMAVMGPRPMLNALDITFSDMALKETEERLFRASRHRSARIRKKLIQRHGGEYRKVPCMFKTPYGIIAHPALRAHIDDAIKRGNFLT